MTKRGKADELMVNKTPLRLIAIDGSLGVAPDEEASPVVQISDEEAITRKVPESAIMTSLEAFPSKPNRAPRWQRFVPGGVVAVVVIGVVVALATSGKRSAPPAPVPKSSAHAPQSEGPSVPQRLPATMPPSPINADPEVIRVQIAAEPKEAELSLDGNVLAGHRLNLGVPKDRGIHVVSASASGYIPFNQQVSFSSDVVLTINLRRDHTLPFRQAARSRAAPVESRPKSDVVPVAARPAPRIEPGMNLEGPSIRPNAKAIDERNPYKP
jgi:hypothetical protein